jgi:hypothetical protein
MISETLVKKLEKARAEIKTAISGARNPVVFWSGGLDSTLLLFLCLEVKKDIPVIQFRNQWTPAQKKFSDSLIRSLNLKVLTLTPFRSFYIPKNEREVFRVDDYKIDGELFPVIRETVFDAAHCALSERLATTLDFEGEFDLILSGQLDSDKPLFEGFSLPPSRGRVCAPLHELDKIQVALITDYLNLPVNQFNRTGDEAYDTGTLQACTNCFSGAEKEVFCPKRGAAIPVLQWERKNTLFEFAERFLPPNFIFNNEEKEI